MPNSNGREHKPLESNPWGLSLAQLQTFIAVCKGGTFKQAARDVGIPERTIEQRMKRAYDKIPGNNRLLKILAFYRWHLAQEAGHDTSQ